jgi:hypothetical protein
MAEQSATVLTPNALADGLVTAPKETRIARLATVVYQKPEKGLGRSTFRRIAAHESLILVYFDRPCYLSGAIHTRESEIAYDVNVDKAGLQWLKIVKKSSTRYAVSASKSPQEIFLRIVPWIGTAKADEGGPTIEPRLYVTPTTRKTFSPQKVTPAGTVFYVKVLKKADDNAIRLHRCGAPCNNAATVKIWEPESYKSGDELKWRVDKDGTYYLWIQDRKKNAAVVASSDELSGGKLRIVFASGASIETWYIAP